MTPNPDDLLSRVPDAERILDALLDLPPDERQRRAREICERDPELRAFVEPFLAVSADARAGAGADAARCSDAGDAGRRFRSSHSMRLRTRSPKRRCPSASARSASWASWAAAAWDACCWRCAMVMTPTPHVALKLLDTARHSREELDRFARERETLSRLQHPHIARLYDSGVTAEACRIS